MDDRTLKKFAELVLKTGVNLQAGQGLELCCPVEKSYVAEVFATAAYAMGAKIVRIRWESEKIDRINYLGASAEALAEVPKWLIDSKNYLTDNNFCYVAIAAEDPSAFDGVPPEKIAAAAKARAKAFKAFSDKVMANGIRWCVVSVPTKEWAKKVFPYSAEPEKELSRAIENAMRLNAANPVAVWKEHIKKLDERANFLNRQQFKYLHFKNSVGTDFKVGLCDGHKWISAQEKAKDGVPFVANMPTEEVFTAPHRLRADGVVKSAMPLCYEGQIIDGFSITFKHGYETLKRLIDTDDGTKHLGEVALIGKNSPIAESGILFYNTLFDENASCHIAIGKGYPSTVDGSENLAAKELKARGLNDSVEHVDFMIGTADLAVTGISENGEKTPLFADGEWCI